MWFPIALVALLVLALPGLILFAINLFGWETEVSKSLDGASFYTVDELKAHISSFIESYNHDAQPFVWTRTPDQIFAKAIKQQPTSGTLH